MTNQERHRIWCDEHGIEHTLIGTLPLGTVEAIERFNEEHEHCERSIMRSADLERERIIEELKDRRELALENDKDDYASGYADAMENAIGIVSGDKNQ
jgi:hypothetical protein